MTLRKTLIAGISAATLGLAALSAPAEAAGGHYHGGGHGGGWGGHGGYRHGGHWGGAGLGWGLGAGIIGGALAAGALGAYDYGYPAYPAYPAYDNGYDDYGYGCSRIYDQWGNYVGRRCY